jgi:8-oxo-dGTP pyrophosphatase MutT (NUDIX family)
MGSAKLELVGSTQLQPAQSRPDKGERQQVAAVCFRLLSTGIEFLLVQTRQNRWTFAKGGLQSGLTQAQSAALEAYEEAGVDGRIEETSFAQYRLRKTGQREPRQAQSVVHAHLCEVSRLGKPEEINRNPTWFAPTKAKRRLAEGRTSENSAELARILDQAVTRIRRLSGRTLNDRGALIKVSFENPAASPSDAVPRRKILELSRVHPDRP